MLVDKPEKLTSSFLALYYELNCTQEEDNGTLQYFSNKYIYFRHYILFFILYDIFT